MIPKILHYCWFGGNPLPEESSVFIREWQELNAGWELHLWNESNSPMHIPYMKNAYEDSKWANMSNFIRLYALKNYGGIYLDIDVKLIKPLSSLCEHSCFFGFEEGEENSDVFWVNNAICGATQSHDFIAECYTTLLSSFDGTEMANLSGPRMTTDLLKRCKGLARYGYQQLSNITLYPKEYFYPIHYSEVFKIANLEQHLFKETIAVHVWARTWLSKESLLYIIDDLYHLNHKQQIALGLQGETAGKNLGSAAELSTIHPEIRSQIRQLVDSQYFSRSLIEELAQSINKLKMQLAEKKNLTRNQLEQIQDLADKNNQLANLPENADSKVLELEKELAGLDTIRCEFENYRITINRRTEEATALRYELQLKTDKIDLLEQFHTENTRLIEQQRQKEKELVSQLRDHLNTERERGSLLEEIRNEQAKNIDELKKENKVQITAIWERLESEQKSNELLQLKNRDFIGIIDELGRREKELHEKLAESSVRVQQQEQQNKRLAGEVASLEKEIHENESIIFQLQDKLEQSGLIEQKLSGDYVQLERQKNVVEKELGIANELAARNKFEFDRAIAVAQNEMETLKQAVAWYQDTYEKRKLVGIVKDRLLTRLHKFRKAFEIKKGTPSFRLNLKSRKSTILCVIVNHNHNANAKKLKKIFSRYYETVVIDSGSAEKEKGFINLPNVYYSGLYNYAYNLSLENGYDHLFFICSDVVFEEDQAAKMAANLLSIDLAKLGVYSPVSSGRSHYQCKKKNENGLRIVDFVEGFIFLANMKVLNEFSPLVTGKNLFGWGIDVVKGFYAKKLNLLCVVDDGVTVFHPAETGYSSQKAEERMYEWFASLPNGDSITAFHTNRVNLIREGIENDMKISVIIPCFNQAQYLEEAVNSVFCQTHSDFEILIINDGATDDTHEIATRLARQFRQVRYFQQENQGLGAARNTGLRNASGSLIQFLDADDLLSMNKFNNAIKIFANEPGVYVVYSPYLCYEDGNADKTWTYSRVEMKGDPLDDLIGEWEKELSIPIHCFLFRKELLREIFFDVTLPNHEDWEFHLKIAARQPVYKFEQGSTAFYRIKQVAMSQDKTLMKSGKNRCLANLIGSRKFSQDHTRNLIQRLDYSLVIGIITCRKNIERIKTIRETWVRELKEYGIRYFFVMGDPSSSVTYEEGDILFVPSADNYESLAQKVALFYDHLYTQTAINYVFKVDDDCYVNVENIFSTYFWEHDYFGRIVATKEVDLNRSWHFGKCEKPVLNSTLYNGKYLGPWCGGGFGYFLSRSALAALSQKREQLCKELYEDKAIGDALRQVGIFPTENPGYDILNMQQFNIDHKSDREVAELVHNVGSDVFKYDAIIELTNTSYFNQIKITKGKHAANY